MCARSASRQTRRTVTFPKILTVVFLAGGISTGCRAGDAGDTVSKAVRDVFNRAQNSVVKVQGTDAHNHSVLAGTGFFVDPNGMIYTLYTVAGDTEGIIVSY